MILVATLLFVSNTSIAHAADVTVSGYIYDLDGAPVEGARIGFWDSLGGDYPFEYTAADGYYTQTLPEGYYMSDVWINSPGYSTYFTPSVDLTSTVPARDITVLPSNLVVQVMNPDPFLGFYENAEIVSATVSVTQGGSPVQGIPLNAIDLWVHDWTDPANWWDVPQENEYHDKILDIVTLTETSPGVYDIEFAVDTNTGPYSHDEHLGLEVRIDGQTVHYGFRTITTAAYIVQGTVTDLNDDPVIGANVDIWEKSTGKWIGSQTDAQGQYFLEVPEGTFEFGVWDPATSAGYWQANMVVDGPKTKNVKLIPEMNMQPVSDFFLGAYANGDTINPEFTLETGQTPVEGFSEPDFDVWIHNRDDWSDWWDNPVENVDHDHLDPAEYSVSETSPGTYQISYSIDTTSLVFSSGGYFGIDIRAGNAGMGFDFEVLTGDVYTVSGTVTDVTGTPVIGAYVDLWSAAGGAHTETDQNGDYSFKVQSGTYQFGVWHDGLGAGFWQANVLVDSNLVKNVKIIPELNMQPVTDYFLGAYTNGDSVTAEFTLATGQTPVEGFTDPDFDIWIHNRNDQSNWWENPVENSNHEHLDVSEFSISETSPGTYQVEFSVDTTDPIFTNGGYFGVEIRAGNAGMDFDFEVLTGEVYTVSGTVTDIASAPIPGVFVDLWSPTGGSHAETDALGQYSMKVRADTYEFGVWDPASSNGFWQGGFIISDDIVKNIVLLPQMTVNAVDDNWFLGGYIDGDTITARITADVEGTPVTTLTVEMFDLWLHNWDQDQSNWWDNPVENQYHAHLETNELTLVNEGSGEYSISFPLSTASGWHTYGIFQNGGHFNIDMRVGNAGMWFDFEVLTGEVYTVSGTVTDIASAPVPGVFVDMWSQTGGAHAETDANGDYSFIVQAGTYEFGVWDPNSQDGFWQGGFVVNENKVKNVMLLPELLLETEGDWWLGAYTNGDTITASVTATTSQVPVTTLTSGDFDGWIHSWDDPGDWWSNPVENNYHEHLDAGEYTITHQGSGVYELSYLIDTAKPIFANPNLNIELRVANSWMNWGFEVLTGEVYTVSGTVTDLEGTEVPGVFIDLWQQTGGGAHEETDALGQYSMKVRAGTYEFGVWDPNSQDGFWQGGFIVDQNKVKDIKLIPQINAWPEGPGFLGGYIDGDTITGTLYAESNQVPVTGLTSDVFDIWIHNWQNDPGDWWMNPVESQYHAHLASNEVTVNEQGGGYYTVSFTLDTSAGWHTNGMFENGGHFNMDVRVGNAGMGFDFEVLTGEVYTVSGTVTDMVGDPVSGVFVDMWKQEGGAHAETDALGQYSMRAEAGTYEFGVWDETSMAGSWEGGFVVDDDKTKNVVLLPQMWVEAADQQYFIGGYTDGDTVNARFYAEIESTPVTTLTKDALNIWIHNWDQDQSDWWQNPVETQYHAQLDLSELTLVNEGGGYYTIQFDLSTATDWHTYGLFQNGGRYNMDVKIGNSGIWFDFEVLTGDVYTVSGTVSDISGTPIPGVSVDMWSQTGGSHAETDALGQYSMKVQGGTYEFGVWDPNSQEGSWQGGFVVDDNKIKNVVIMPELFVESIGDWWLGGYINADPVTASIRVEVAQTPVTTLTSGDFDGWIHSWDDPGDWWSNPVENNYHEHLDAGEYTATHMGGGIYELTFTVDTAKAIYSNPNLNLEFRLANSWMNWGFEVLTGEVYAVDGTVTDILGIPVPGVNIDLWRQSGGGAHAQTDALGEYSVRVRAGTWEFGVWDEQTQNGFWQGGFVVDADTTKNVVLTPQLNIMPEGPGFLGGYIGGDTITAQLYAESNSQPILGLPGDIFDIWIHNWQQDPGDWWMNPVENQYHAHLASNEVTVNEQGGGYYTVSFTLDTSAGWHTNGMFENGGHFNMDVRVGNSGMGYDFEVLTGDVYTVSGTVTDLVGTPVPNVNVDLWQQAGGGAHAETNALGQYSVRVQAGTYEFGIWDEATMSGTWQGGFVVDSDETKNFVLTPQLWIEAANQMYFLGGYADGDIVNAQFYVESEGTPVDTLTESVVDAWIHNWDQDQSDWWQNPVENQYHAHLETGEITLVNDGGGFYTLQFTMDIDPAWHTYGIFQNGGRFSMDLKVGNGGIWFDFEVYTGTVYTVSGTVTDILGNPVEGVYIDMWSQTGGAHAETNALGQYIFKAPEGTYEFGVWDEDSMTGTWQPGFVLDQNKVKNILLAPDIQMNPIDDTWRGGKIDQDIISARFELMSGETQITGFTKDNFDIWIHNNDDWSNWWGNPIENQFHERLDDAEYTLTEPTPGRYTIAYTLDTSKTIFSNGGNFGVDVRSGNAGMTWNFEILTGDVHTVSGTITDVSGDPVEGVYVDLWRQDGGGGHTETDELGQYLMRVQAGTWEFGVWNDDTQSGFWQGGFVVDDDKIKDVVLTPQLSIWTEGPGYLGGYVHGDTVTGTLYAESNEVPVEGLSSAAFDLWIHNWQDDQSNWWDNPVENQYHVHLEQQEILVEDLGNGYYTVSFVVDTTVDWHTYGTLANGERFNMDVRIGNSGMGFDFEIFTGTVYTVSGTVSDIQNNPVEGAYVDLWGPEGGAHAETNAQGQYSMRVQAGTYEFGVWDEISMTGIWLPNIVVDSNVVKDVRIADQMMMMPLGNQWLGGYIDGDTIEAQFELKSGDTHVSGFTANDFDIWVHNWDQDQSDWWQNPVENQYHEHLSAGDFTVTETNTGSEYVFDIASDDLVVIQSQNTWEVYFESGTGNFQVTEVETGTIYDVTTVSPDTIVVTEDPAGIYTATYTGPIQYEITNSATVETYVVTMTQPTTLVLESVNGEYELSYPTPVEYTVTESGVPVDVNTLDQSYQDLLNNLLSASGLHNILFSGIGTLLDPSGLTVTDLGDGYYTISYVLDTNKPIFSNGGHFGMDIKAGNAGMPFDFEILTGEVYTISGTVTDVAGTPIEGVFVDLWGPSGGGHTETDENGDYQMRITAGIWEFGTWDEVSQTGTYSPGLSITSDLVRDVVIAPQMDVFSEGMGFLGAYVDDDTVTAQVRVESNSAPILGLPTSLFDVWIHNWQEDQSDWWSNPVENLYHTHLTPGEYTVQDNVDGTYDISFTVDTAIDWHTYGVFQNGGHFNFEVQVGNQGTGFGFEVLTGDVYTLSGTVTDVSGAPIEGAYVDLWKFNAGGGHTETDALGQYSMIISGGTWELGVYDEVSMTGYYEAGLVIDQNTVKDITILPQLEAEPVGDDPFLGFVEHGDILTADFELYEGQTPYTGFDTSILTVWIHSQADPSMQDQDPSNDWFMTRLPNEYHSDITAEATLSEVGGGVYRVVYTVDTTDPVQALGGGFGLEIEFAGHGVHWPFGIITGDVYTVSGTVTDLLGNPVDGAKVSVWEDGFWFGDKTNSQGQYLIMCPVGTYEFGVDFDPGSNYNPYYEPVLVVDGDVTGHDVVVTGEGPPPVQGQTIIGKVTDGTNPVLGAEVEFYAEPDVYNTVTDAQGDYSIVVPGGLYEFLVFSPDSQTLSGYIIPDYEVQVDATLNVVLTPIPQGSPVVSGTVYAPDGTTPVQDADVAIVYNTAMYESVSESNGQYAITVPVGTYDAIVCFPPHMTPYDEYYDNQIGLIDSNRVYDITLTEGGGPPPGGDFTVSGVVTDVPGTPLPGIDLEMYDYVNDLTYDAVSDQSGYYEFNVPPSSYDFMVLTDSNIFEDYPQEDLTLTQDLLNHDVVLTVIAPPQPPTGDFTVSGTVTDGVGPVSGADVGLFDMTNDYYGVTDAQGQYSIVVPTGTYEYEVLPPNPETHSGYYEGEVIIDANLVKDVTLIITPPGSPIVAGVVQTPEFTPVAGVEVAINLGAYSYEDVTDALGQYSITVPVGTYDLIEAFPPEGSELPEHFNDQIGLIDTNMDYDIILGGGPPPGGDFTVSGVVTDGAGPVSGAEVSIFDVDNEYFVLTDALGEYSLTVPSGTYEYEVLSPDPDTLSGYWIDNLVVGTNLVKDVSLMVIPGGSPFIYGVVQNSQATPVPNVEVVLMMGEYFFGKVTDGTGEYFFPVPIGFYTSIEAIPPEGSGLPDFYDDQIGVVDADREYNIILASGPPPASYVIRGVITDDRPVPIPGIAVQMYDYINDITYDEVTDAQGNYQFTVPGGNYDFMILADPQIFEQIPTEDLTVNANFLDKDYILTVIIPGPPS